MNVIYLLINKRFLYIPKGYVNGFRALEANAKLMIMSNYGFNEIENDQIRFDQNKWDQMGRQPIRVGITGQGGFMGSHLYNYFWDKNRRN